MALFILDEWLWSDLSGENGKDKQKETFEFLSTIYNKCDQIVIVRGSRYDQKTIKFWRHSDVTRHRFAKFYQSRFLYNSDKSIILEQDRLPLLPQHIVRRVNRDDHYIIQAYLAQPDSAIITTDAPLKDILIKDGIKCQHRDEFVPSYISEYMK